MPRLAVQYELSKGWRDRDKQLDELAKPGKCLGSGVDLSIGIRDREYAFSTISDRMDARKRFAKKFPWLLEF